MARSLQFGGGYVFVCLIYLLPPHIYFTSLINYLFVCVVTVFIYLFFTRLLFINLFGE